MTETLGAIVSGVVLVLFSMIGGGIAYALIKDCVKRRMSGNE